MFLAELALLCPLHPGDKSWCNLKEGINQKSNQQRYLRCLMWKSVLDS